jgi:hypothetical protein
MESSEILYEKLIEENLDKGYQLKLVMTDFKEVLYLQIRKYFLSYEGEWLPSREGVSMPASIENVQNLLAGILDCCAKAEGKEIVNFFYKQVNSDE